MSEDATEVQPGDTLEVASTAMLLNPRVDLSYQGLVVEVAALIAKASTLVVTTATEAKVATDHLGAIDERQRFIETSRNEYLAPLRKHTTDINEAMKELMAPLSEADKALRGRILAFNAEQKAEVARKEEIVRKERELAALKDEPEPEPAPAPEPARTFAQGNHTQSSERMVTKYEVVDFAALPDDYKIQDTGKLTKAVKAGGTSLTIAGVRIWQEPVLAIGRAP